MDDTAPIFTIWLTDREWGAMPYLYEICIASWQVFNPDRKIIIYSNHNLHLSFLDRTITEVRNVNSYFPGLYTKAEQISDKPAHQSDYIRYTILKDFPGVYLDTDVLCYKGIEDLIAEFDASDKEVMFCKEDDNMICNACIFSKGNGKDVFNDILNEYDNRFIKHSYLFNSQKYLHLMVRRYPEDVGLFAPNRTIFEPSWMLSLKEQEKMLSEEPNFEGFGHHLYSSVYFWEEMRDYINKNIYNKQPNNYIQNLTSKVINEYINLMKEADRND